MKRILPVIFAIALVLLIPAAAFADVGMPVEPLFESFVITKDFTVTYTDYTGDYEVQRTVTLPIGTKLSFYDRYQDSSGNTVWDARVMLYENFEIWTSIPDDQMRITMPSKEVFPTKKAPDPDYEVVATVDADPCLNIRNGPSTGFNIIGLIPDNTVITYRYVYDNWGYVTYDNVSGWVSLDYVEINQKTPLKASAGNNGNNGNTGNNTGNNGSGNEVTVTGSDDDGEDNWKNVPKTGESVGEMFDSDSGRLLIFCIIGAVLLAVVVLVVIILIVKFSNKRS
ncbi:MAG: SH3 domain-containing protein [Clostridia bacterium]|nr:SH3 domain-containing protein [Clostridia bacterium]